MLATAFIDNTKVMSKGQFTIPKDIRQLLRLSCGNRFYFIVDSKPKYTFGKFRHICYESSSKGYG